MTLALNIGKNSFLQMAVLPLILSIYLLPKASAASPDLGTKESRSFKFDNATQMYCVYNKYSTDDYIYECNRINNPKNDTNCRYQTEIYNYWCNIDSPYTGPYQCDFDYYQFQSLWYDSYQCYSDVKRCGYSLHNTYQADGDKLYEIKTLNLTEGDKCQYQIYAQQKGGSYISFSQGIEIVKARGVNLTLVYQNLTTGESTKLNMVQGDIFDFEKGLNSYYRLILSVANSTNSSTNATTRKLSSDEEDPYDNEQRIFMKIEIGTVRGGLIGLQIDQTMFGISLTIGIACAVLVILGLIIFLIVFIVRRIRHKRLHGQRLNDGNNDPENIITQTSIQNEELDTMVAHQPNHGQQRRRNGRRNQNRRNRRQQNQRPEEQVPINNNGEENNFIVISSSEVQIVQSPQQNSNIINNGSGTSSNNLSVENSKGQNFSQEIFRKNKPTMIRPVVEIHADDFEVENLDLSKRKSNVNLSPSQQERPSKLSESNNKRTHTDDKLDHFELIEEMKMTCEDCSPSKVYLTEKKKKIVKIDSERPSQSKMEPNIVDDLSIRKMRSGHISQLKITPQELNIKLIANINKYDSS